MMELVITRDYLTRFSAFAGRAYQRRAIPVDVANGLESMLDLVKELPVCGFVSTHVDPIIIHEVCATIFAEILPREFTIEDMNSIIMVETASREYRDLAMLGDHHAGHH